MTFSLSQLVGYCVLAFVIGAEVIGILWMAQSDRAKKVPPARSAASRRASTFTGNESDSPIGLAGDQSPQ